MDQLILSRKFEKAAKPEAPIFGNTTAPSNGSRERVIGILFVACLSGMFFLYQKVQSDQYQLQSQLNTANKNVETKTSENKLLRSQLKELKFDLANIDKRYDEVLQRSFNELKENKTKITFLENTIADLHTDHEKLQSKLNLCQGQEKSDPLPKV